ncbi:putative E3 ubiquitin-protein ligase XBAT35 isoform X6 [Wolffia australiana]
MGIEQSKEASLYESVRRGDVNSMRRLHRSGASVNWISFSGKTPLILACSSPHLLRTAKELIDMGADVNYCNYDSHFGTPLQRAAQRGLLQTASLLLSHGANPLIAGFMRRNALDSARDENHAEIVRIIEDKICFFSGLLRKLDDTVIQDMEKIWVVVLPGDSSLSTDVTRLKMATYRNRHSAKPSKILSLRHYTFKRPDFNQQDPEFVLVDESSGHRMRLRSGETGMNFSPRLIISMFRRDGFVMLHLYHKKTLR